MAVIDASVYVALLNSNEPGHIRSWAWLQKAQEDQEPIRAPVILLAEVAAAIGRGTGNPTLARRAVQGLVRTGVVELVPVTLPLTRRAAEIACEHRIRGCDALYVALAGQMEECLVTLDRQQLERGRAVVTVTEP